MMVSWKRKGAAVVGAVKLTDGRTASAVLVGPRQNPNGAMLVMAGKAGAPAETTPFTHALALLAPEQVVDILCMQERIFGDRGLPVPDELPA